MFRVLRHRRVSSPAEWLALTLLVVAPLIDVSRSAGAAPPSSTPEPRETASTQQSSATSIPADTTKPSSEPSPIADPESAAAREAAPVASQAEQERTALKLLGQTDASSGESRRNENVQFDLVNNNALKELNVRLGATATIVRQFQINQGYFGAEFGKKPTPVVNARPRPGSDIHGNIFWDHNNSIFSARSFFQVGEVKPARENQYGGSVGLPLWKRSRLTLTGSQTKIRGSDAPGIGNVDGDRRDRPMVVDPSVLGRTIGHPDNSTQLLPRSAFRFINAPAEMWATSAATLSAKGISLT